jgi:hypothetical protein
MKIIHTDVIPINIRKEFFTIHWEGTEKVFPAVCMTAANTGESALTPLGFIIVGFLLEKMPVWIFTGFAESVFPH